MTRPEIRRAAFAAASILVSLLAAASGFSEPAAAKATYKNPLLPRTEMADPHVIQVDGAYYLYATTHTRAYEVFVSTNLVDWVNKGEVYTDARKGLWAPDVLRDVNASGKFFLYYTANEKYPPRGPLAKVIGVAEASSPMGPFIDKATLATLAIDAHLFEDGGKYYLYYVDLDGGFTIKAQPMKTPTVKAGDAIKLIQPTEPWEMKSGHVTEGPFILKREGIFYLMYSGTGADSPDYGIGYATSKSPLGPFKKHAGNPIVSRHGNVLGPGHHCVVTAPDGQPWMLYHQKWEDDRSFHRFLALDRLWFDANGQIKAEATRDVEKPVPATTPEFTTK